MPQSTVMRTIIYLAVTAVLAFVVLFLNLAMVQAALFAPGPSVHAHQVGCNQCHQPFQTTYSCTDSGCHPIALPSFKALPDYYFHKLVSGQACPRCHQEHLAPLDAYANQPFKHGLFLTASSQNCIGCHQLPSGFLHDSLLHSEKCGVCHSDLSWQTARFAHSELRLAVLVACDKCHNAPPNVYHQLVSPHCGGCHHTEAWFPAQTNHAELNSKGVVLCGVCHRSPPDQEHQSTGLDCGSCHNTRTWLVAATANR